MTYILRAPAKSGYTEAFDTLREVRERVAEILGVEDAIEVDSPDLTTTYCYATQMEADLDKEGAYALQYRERSHHAV